MIVRLLVVGCAAIVAAGCRISAWTWSSGSGTHELSFPPAAAATPEPTPPARH
jgi:hypothetical protein